MNTKVCRICKKELEFALFSPNRRRYDGLQTDCKACKAAYNKDWYRKNKQAVLVRSKVSNSVKAAKRREWLYKYLLGHPCVDCGETDPVVLQFDHIGKKHFAISKRYLWTNEQQLLKEILKCEVRCANCHTRKTAQQVGWFKSQGR